MTDDGPLFTDEGVRSRLSRRTCIVTRKEADPDTLVRFVLDPAGQLVPDLDRHLPGRGVWVGLSRSLIEEAVRKDSFSKAFRRKVAVPADLAPHVEAGLVRRLLDRLSLAKKAGVLVAGFAKVEAAIEKGEARLLIHAGDAAQDGVHKLDRKFKAVTGDASGSHIISADITAEQIGLALGRQSVVHILLKGGGASDNVRLAAQRLYVFRSGTILARDQRASGLGGCGSADC